MSLGMAAGSPCFVTSVRAWAEEGCSVPGRALGAVTVPCVSEVSALCICGSAGGDCLLGPSVAGSKLGRTGNLNPVFLKCH